MNLQWDYRGSIWLLRSSGRRRVQGSVRPESSMKSKRQPWNNRQAKELPYPQPSLCGGSSIKPPASCHSTQLSGGRHQSRFLLLLYLLLALSVPFQPQALLLLPSTPLFLDCLYISKIVNQGKTSGCRWHFLKLILNAPHQHICLRHEVSGPGLTSSKQKWTVQKTVKMI